MDSKSGVQRQSDLQADWSGPPTWFRCAIYSLPRVVITKA